MTAPERSDLDALLAAEGECVSILVPTARSGREVQQGRIRLKNLLREAENRLTGKDFAGTAPRPGERPCSNGHRKDEIQAMLRPGYDLLEDEGRWRSLEDGLAVFLAPGFARSMTVAAPVEEALVIGSRFYLLPLLPLMENRDQFLVLAMSMNKVRLFSADRFEAKEMDLPGVPKSLTDAVGSDWEQDSVQIHTARPGAGSAILHGHGIGQGEDDKEEAARYCLRVDAGIRAALGNGKRPMVVAAAEPLASIYRQTSHYPNLVAEVIAGNPDLASGDELRQRAWKLLEPMRGRELEADLARCRELLGTGRASIDPREIVPAACDGRVEALLVAAGAQRWGTYDPATRSVEVADEPANGREELLNLAAGQTVRAGGRVHLVPRDAMPQQANVAAVFRY